MHNVVGIKFKGNSRIYYFSPKKLDVIKEMNIIVETERGFQFGAAVTNVMEVKKEKLTFPIKDIVRIATVEDEKEYARNQKDSKDAIKQCVRLASKYKLDMKIIDAEFTFDRSQLVFHFIAENRVDFRSLAKDLASIYKTRIELRQVGVRDKAKEVGGLGICGRGLCCSSFLSSFESVSINMAKNQNISLNPTKINGACGRLLCCLNYENDVYEKNRKDMPDIGQKVTTKHGDGRVIALDILRRAYKVIHENDEIEIVEMQ